MGKLFCNYFGVKAMMSLLVQRWGRVLSARNPKRATADCGVRRRLTYRLGQTRQVRRLKTA